MSAASHDENKSPAGPVHSQAQTGDKRTARDPHGLPLVPQPTEYEDDRLNGHPALKLSAVVQISFLALMGPLGAAAPNPAFVVMSEHFGLSVHEISYDVSREPAVQAKLFTEFYGFSTLQTGLMLNVPLLLGGIIGELCAGWLADWLSDLHAKRISGERLPETELTAI